MRRIAEQINEESSGREESQRHDDDAQEDTQRLDHTDVLGPGLQIDPFDHDEEVQEP